MSRDVFSAVETPDISRLPAPHWCLHKFWPCKSHRRQPVDGSIPTYLRPERFPGIPPAAAGGWFIPSLCFPLLSAQVGNEPSTGCRRRDSRDFLVSCRSGLNDPPAAAGGIWLNVTCGVTNGLRSPYRTACRPYTHLQTSIAVRTTIKARAPFGAEMYRPNLFVAFCRRLAEGQIALRTSDILIIWPVEILFTLISSGSGALQGEQAAAARYGAGIAILNGGGDGSGEIHSVCR